LFAIRRGIIVCFFCGEVVYMNCWSEREKEKRERLRDTCTIGQKERERERGCVRRQR
jgi:hypothetical protein